MADLADMAQERIEQQLEISLRNMRRKEEPSAEFCESCGEEIPEKRRIALPGVTLCVDCKSLEEALYVTGR